MRTFLEGRIPAQHITEEVQRDVENVVHNDACLEDEDALDEEEVQFAVLKLPTHHHFCDYVSHFRDDVLPSRPVPEKKEGKKEKKTSLFVFFIKSSLFAAD
jgi:hypothetical protein